MKITIQELKNRAKTIENNLIAAGFNVKIMPYFCYGMYGYDLNFDKGNGKIDQICTGLGTKKECYNNLDTAYYKALAYKQDYLPQ